ncbi:esterase/lipase family protein [Conexibacter woesei]|uniref:esterase/lipase family protein n=1 Tax=Conexibacter woesei TaxID=191495 RepID=UPI00041AF6F1|nr:lipase [Conexibacter woesei]
MSPLRTALALAAIVVLAAIGAAPAGATLPVVYNFSAAALAAQASPGAAPAGANDPTCVPSTAHPRPVVLVNGTFADQITSWNAIAPLLKNEGYCVYTFTYGVSAPSGLGGTGPVAASAGQLSTEVDAVLTATGASEVDIVGWSQGGMMPRYYLKNLGGAAKVHTLVGLAPSNHGTTLLGIFTLTDLLLGGEGILGAGCEACSDQHAGSAFLTALNAGGDTVSGVDYTVIETAYDEVVTPYSSAFLSGPSVTNITLQSQCLLDLGDHISIPYDHVAARDVLNALDPAHAVAPTCSPVVAGVGG